MAGPRGDYTADRPWAENEAATSALVQLGAVIVGFVSPLVGWLLLRDRSTFLRQSLRSALNFQLTVLLAGLVLGLLVVVALATTGFVPASTGYYQALTIVLTALLFAAVVLSVLNAVCCVIGAIRANGGTVFRYPLTIHFVK